MEVEILDDEDFACLEAACLQAEQRSTAIRKRRLPASFTPIAPPPPLPYLIYRGRTSYCQETALVERAAEYFLAVGGTVGFDIEWKVTYITGASPRPVALIQLCFRDPGTYNPDGGPPYHSYLLHVHHCGGIPPKLAQLLNSETVRKAGVGIHGDSLKLARDFGIQMQGLMHLSSMANERLCNPEAGILPQKWSMVTLAEKLLRGRVKKSQDLRCSDWEQIPLTAEQQQYAATDAWLSLKLYEVLENMPITWQAVIPQVLPVTCNGTTGLGTGTTEEESCTANNIVPACTDPAPLQPAKRAVLQQHAQGWSVAKIASQRAIQFSTVQSYLAEAIVAGYSYDWGRIAVSSELMSSIAEATTEALRLGTPLKAALPENASEIAALSAAYRPRDLLAEVLDAKGIKSKELQEEWGELAGGDQVELGFGELRLAMAHLGRCNAVAGSAPVGLEGTAAAASEGDDDDW